MQSLVVNISLYFTKFPENDIVSMWGSVYLFRFKALHSILFR
jgi:hypothetical protein